MRAFPQDNPFERFGPLKITNKQDNYPENKQLQRSLIVLMDFHLRNFYFPLTIS
jgi:hypothetical protein